MKKQIIILLMLLAIPSQIWPSKKEGPEEYMALVKNETGETIIVKQGKKSYRLRDEGTKHMPIEPIKKGSKPTRWQKYKKGQKKFNKDDVYYQILPHKNIVMLILKPYGKYDVEIKVKKLFGLGKPTTKLLKNQAADISTGMGKKGIYFFNATKEEEEPIDVQALYNKWEKIKPNTGRFIEKGKPKKKRLFASVSEEETIVKWKSGITKYGNECYAIYPDKKIKTEKIKSIVLKPNGWYVVTVKKDKTTTETMLTKDGKEEHKAEKIFLPELEGPLFGKKQPLW